MVELEHIRDGDHQIEELCLKAAPLIGEGFEFLGELQQLELGEPVALLKGAASLRSSSSQRRALTQSSR